MLIVNDAINLSGRGFTKVISPIPEHGGKLYAAHLCGSQWDGAPSAGDDWSGNDRNLVINGATVSANALTGVSTVLHPRTTFTPTDLVGTADDVVIMVAARIPTGSPTTPLFNAGGTAPYIALQAVEAGNRIQAFVFGSDGLSTSVNLTYDVGVENRYATFGARFSKTSVQPFYVNPATGLLVLGVATAHARGLSGTAPFKLANAAAPNVGIAATAFYRGSLTDIQIAAVHAAWVSRGIPVA